MKQVQNDTFPWEVEDDAHGRGIKLLYKLLEEANYPMDPVWLNEHPMNEHQLMPKPKRKYSMYFMFPHMSKPGDVQVEFGCYPLNDEETFDKFDMGRLLGTRLNSNAKDDLKFYFLVKGNEYKFCTLVPHKKGDRKRFHKKTPSFESVYKQLHKTKSFMGWKEIQALFFGKLKQYGLSL